MSRAQRAILPARAWRASLCSRLLLHLTLPLLALALPGCGGLAPVVAIGEDPARRGYHTVRRGDTMYSIAFRHGLDYRALAQANAVPPPYTIRIGQVLRLAGRAEPEADSGPRAGQKPLSLPSTAARSSPGQPRPAAKPPGPAAARALPPVIQQRQNAAARPAGAASKPAPQQASEPTARATQSSPKSAPAKPSAQASASAAKPSVQAPAWPKGKPSFVWPVKGKLLARFSLRQPVNKGIDIAGRKGDPVAAAADGMVVYAGGNLRGYGKLVIIKHNDQYLTAYGNNDKMLVKEGDQVKRGDTIARIGADASKRELLHFEIREDGKPRDPLAFLP